MSGAAEMQLQPSSSPNLNKAPTLAGVTGHFWNSLALLSECPTPPLLFDFTVRPRIRGKGGRNRQTAHSLWSFKLPSFILMCSLCSLPYLNDLWYLNSLPFFFPVKSHSRAVLPFQSVHSAALSKGREHCCGSKNRGTKKEKSVQRLSQLPWPSSWPLEAQDLMLSSGLKQLVRAKSLMIKKWHFTCGLIVCPNKDGSHFWCFTWELVIPSTPVLSALLYMSDVSGQCHGNSRCAASPPLNHNWMVHCRCSTVGEIE